MRSRVVIALGIAGCARGAPVAWLGDGGDLEDGGRGAPPGASEAGELADAGPRGAVGPGHVVFRLLDGHWHRVAATAGGAPEDLDVGLSALSPGADEFASLSPDGAWVAVVTTRFNCATGECVGLARADLGAAALVGSSSAAGRPAVAPGGALVVYPASGGPHKTDLFAVRRRHGGDWSAPVLLTASSPGAYQHDAVVSADGAKVVFDCGPTPYQAANSAICEVGTDGAGLRVVVSPLDGPGGGAANETHHPAYAPGGRVVFEADWQGSERVWRIASTGGAPVRISPDGVNNDNSPCVLPDGRIVSLWLGRAGNAASMHEMKVMSPDGTGAQMILTGEDIVDVGETCGN